MGLGEPREIRKGGAVLKGDRKKKHGTVSEDRIAKRLKYRKTPGSGALAGAKSDSYNNDYRLESKSTINQSMSLKLAWLEKIHREARETNRTPALSVSFVNHDGSSKSFGDWVMIPISHFQHMTEVIDEIRQKDDE